MTKIWTQFPENPKEGFLRILDMLLITCCRKHVQIFSLTPRIYWTSNKYGNFKKSFESFRKSRENKIFEQNGNLINILFVH